MLAQIAIFVVAAFLGFELISRVPSLLHTPLMSATNAIHGIVLVGAVISLAAESDSFTTVIGMIAVIFGALFIVDAIRGHDPSFSTSVTRAGRCPR